MPEDREYRVRWRREGMPRRSSIRQTRAGAEAKVEALRWSDLQERGPDPETGEPDYFGPMPAIVEGPTIQSREVGEWEDVDA